ncbi:helix-turn-helix domain-containing protein [Vibrio rotiferianus]|uniref:helix-turn-helix domain-containing protein n=1 Tax=Vibrio rotiferianus TaxID=190895 RepID=UPI00148BC54F|nr:helix-turn-helix domain-containing protein [Vibrio rotiferianus]NOH69065.1 helix-turn-helix domain-containing protein [Vibrio rotiferianus]
MTSRNSVNRIKSHRYYTVREVSDVLGVHFKTIRNWLKVGLPVADETRPLLIRGTDLKVYLKQKRRSIQFNGELHEMSCFRCRQAMKPNLDSVRFIAQPAGMVHMSGVCEECGCRINKYVSWRNVNEIWLKLDGKLPIAEKHIIQSGNSPLYCPLDGVSKDEK